MDFCLKKKKLVACRLCKEVKPMYETLLVLFSRLSHALWTLVALLAFTYLFSFSPPAYSQTSESCTFNSAWNSFKDKKLNCNVNVGVSKAYKVTGIPSGYCINVEWYRNGIFLTSQAYPNGNASPGASFSAATTSTLEAVVFNCATDWQKLESHKWTINVIPAPPSSIRHADVTTNSARISWTTGSGALYTIIEFRKTGSSSWSEWGEYLNSPVTLNGLDPDTEYDVRLQSRAGGTDGSKYSTYLTSTRRFRTSKPPTGLVGVSISPTAAVQAGARWRVNGGAWQNSGTVVDGLLADCTHKIEFFSIAGWSTPATINNRCVYANTSSLINVSYAQTEPDAPGIPSASPSAAGVALSWGSVTGATSYEIYRCSNSTIGSCGSRIADRVSTSFTDTDGLAGTSYHYRIKACIGSLCSSFSSARSAARLMPPPLVPAAPVPSQGVYDTYVKLDWSTLSNTTYYEVYRCLDSSSSSCAWVADSSTTSYDDSDISRAVKYVYRLKACRSGSDPECSSLSPSSAQGYSSLPYTVLIKNVNGQSTPIPGGSAEINRVVNSAGGAASCGVANSQAQIECKIQHAGTVTHEVYRNVPGVGQEYWGYFSPLVDGGGTKIFTRNMPYIANVQFQSPELGGGILKHQNSRWIHN